MPERREASGELVVGADSPGVAGEAGASVAGSWVVVGEASGYCGD